MVATGVRKPVKKVSAKRASTKQGPTRGVGEVQTESRTLKVTHVPYDGTKLPEDVLILDGNDEFEAAIIEMVKFQRGKRKQYGSDGDPLWNFYEIAHLTNLTPLRAGEVLIAKHGSAMQKWWKDHDQYEARDRDVTNSGPANPTHTPGSDDAYMDRAVYSLLLLVLYKRDA